MPSASRWRASSTALSTPQSERRYASLLYAESNPAEAINGIPVGLLNESPPAERVWKRVFGLASRCDAVVAHNAEFDMRFVPHGATARTPWICSCYDLLWPKAPKPGASLVTLALSHGLGVSHAHRAMVDCEILSRLFTRIHEMGTDLRAFFERGLRPKATFQALVPFDRKDEAKNEGFSWDGASKRWLRTMAIEDATALGFSVRRI